MADIQANIGIGVDTSQALASIRQLQREISVFHTLMAKGGADAAAKSRQMQQGLVNTINETGRFSAGMTRISSSTESFTNALEKNKLSMGQYFRYAGGASKSFGKMFSREFNTINRVATERVKDLQTQYISMGRDANGALQSIKVRPLALDMDNLGTKVQLAAQKQQIFNQLMKQGTTNLLNFGKNTQWAGRQLMVGFTIPLTIFGATAAREFRKLEEQAVKFRRVYGDMFTTDADTEKALANVRQLAEEFTKYGVAVEKTIGLAAKVAQMGNVGEDLTAQVTQATRLAVLGGLEQEEALDTTISLTNAFGIAAEDLAGKIAFLNAAENQTILSIEDFNEAIPKAGSVVQQLGGDVEDLAFFLTAMREGGINASQGANALKTSLARLVAPTEVAKKEMAAFGIDIVGIVENNAGNLRNTVLNLGQELDNLDPLNRARAIEQLFGKFQFARMSTMFQNISKEGSQAAKVLDLTTSSVQELQIIADRELKAVEDSPAFRLQKQMEELKAALAPIGEEFIKAVGPLIEFGTKLLKSFNNLGDGSKQFVVVLTAVAGVVAPALLMGFGLIANGVANLIKFIKFLSDTFGMLSGKSTLLGGQTEYMTQQQIEAAAVAASLGQSHSNLTQIFTSEASAISNLVTQYRAAIQAQRQLSIGQTAAGVARMPMGPRPRGFATGGIIRGPGTGTSDSIMAMISNGEAVIPAAQVKKYGTVVEQLISGNIPGYAFGEIVGGPGTYRAVGPSAIMAKGNTASSPIDMNWLAQSPIAPISTASAIKSQRESATGTGYDDISAEGQAATEYAGQRLQQHAQNTESFVDAAKQAYQDTLKYLEEQVAATKMSAQEAEEIATATRVTLDPTKEDVLAGEVAFPRQGLEERDGDIVAGKPRDERKGTSNKKRARTRLRKELESSGYGKEEAFDIAEDRELSFAHVQDSIKLSQEEAEGLGLDTTPTPRGKSEKLPQELDLLERKKAGETVPRGTPLASSESELQALEQEAASIGTNIVRSNLDAQESEAGIGSPAKRFIEIGRNIVNSTATGMKEEAAEQTKKPPLPGNLAAPKPPAQPAAAQPGRFGKLFSSAKDKINESKIAQKAADYLGGVDLDDKITVGPGMSNEEREAHRTAKSINQDLFDKGLITEDMQATQLGQTQGVTPVRVVDGQLDIGDNSIDQLADASPAANDAAERNELTRREIKDNRVAQEEATEATQDLAKSQEQQAKEDKAARKEQKRQNRQSRAGKALGALGTATMVAGMATQVEGRVGEVAQKALPALAGLSAVAPLLMALPLPLAALVAVVGLVAFGFYKYNQMLKEATKNARELAEAMGAGKESLGVFAEAAGTVSATELMNRNRQLGSIDVQLGKSEFGENFIGSDAGAEYVKSVEEGMEELGKSETTKKLGVQLATAVSSNILTPEQAAGIAVELGRAVGDTSVSMGILGELTSLIGPGGENLIEDGLTVRLNLIDQSMQDVFGAGGTLSNLLESISDPENYNQGRGWLDALFSTKELQAQLAGELMAVSEQRQEIFDADEAAFDKRIAQLKEEESLLRQQGKTAEADKKAQDIVGETNEFWANRAVLIKEANQATSALFDSLKEVEGFGSVVDSIRQAFSSGETIPQKDIENMRKYIEMYNEQKADDQEAISIDGLTDLEIARKFLDEEGKISRVVDNIATGMRGTFDQMGEIIKGRFSEASDDVQTRVGKLVDGINDEASGINDELRFNLLVGLGNDQLGFGEVENFLNSYSADVEKVTEDQIAGVRASIPYATLTEEEAREIAATNNERMQSAFNNVVEGLGAGAGQQLFGIFDRVDETTERLLTNNLSDALAIGTPEAMQDATNLLDVMSNIASYGEGTIDVEAAINVLVSNPKALEEFNSKMQEMDKLLSQYGEDLTAELTFSTIFEVDSAGFDALNAQAEYFNDLPASQQKLFVSTFLTQFLTGFENIGTPEGDAQVNEYKAEQTAALPPSSGAARAIQSMTSEEVMTQIALKAAKRVTAALQAAGFDVGDTGDSGSSGGAEPQLDSLLRKLKNVRDASIDLKKGWAGMQEVLSSIFAGGTKELNLFDGLEKQLRDLDLGEGLIAQIVGMDPDEFEKRKDELFKFDGKRIIGATAALTNMNKAFDAVAIGEYVNGQEKFITKTKNQISAISTLTANGMSLADAYEAVQDEALAAAVAQGATAEQIKEILRVTELAKQVEEDLEKERERSRISESVRKTNEEFSNQVAILRELSKAQGQYSDEQVKAIMGDSDLQKLFLDPTIDEDALEAALQNAAEKANLEVQIAIAEGREEELFGQYLTEVNDYFSKEEAVIGVNFEMDTADESKIIEDAQRQIAAIQYQLDDYNAELEQISWSEEDINEKYDKRVEALDEIADANKKIADQQKAQLDIADALSKGDIAAAARATAELRSQQAKDAQESQKEQLDRAREAELKQLTGASGMTREQLEDAITSLERQVFQLEETALEPAQERVRLAEITRDLAIEQLELNGMTRDEFDQIAAATSLAALNMEDMAKSAEKLIAMSEFIQTGKKPANWEELFPTPKAAPAPAPARSSGGGGGGSAPTGKANWTIGPGGQRLEDAAREAGFGTWQEFYNTRRDLDTSLIPASGGGLIGMAMGGLAKKSRSGPPLQMAMGGKVGRYANGGMIIPKRMAMGGYSMGSDIVPAILTPGEFVVRRPAVSAFGVDKLEKINRGTYNDGSVYNYNLAVNVKSDSDPNRIARAVITNIKSIENQRIRGNKL